MTDGTHLHEPDFEAHRSRREQPSTPSAGASARVPEDVHAHEHAFAREAVVDAVPTDTGDGMPVTAATRSMLSSTAKGGVPAPELDRILITRMHARGHHGVFAHERRDGQDFYVDAEAWVDAAAASQSDHIGDTLHYGEWMHALHAIVTGEPVDLIETLAERLADATFAFDDAVAVRITVHKPQAPVALEFEDVAVSILRHRPAPAYSESGAAHAAAPANARTPALVTVAQTASDAAIVLDTGGAPNPAAPQGAAATGVFSQIAQREQDTRQPSDAAVVISAGGAPNVASEGLERRLRQAVIALGANLGDRDATLASALSSIRELPTTTLLAASSLYETPALTLEGVSESAPAYRNAVVLVETELPAAELMQALHRIEDAHGRTRETRWGSRTLDLDLIQVAGETSEGALQLPHPRAHERAFVLAPWLEIDANAQLAPHGSVAELRAAATDRVELVTQ